MDQFLYNAGICLYAPGGTPQSIVILLNAALNRAGQLSAVKHRFAELGIDTVQSSPRETASYIRELMNLVDEMRTAVFGKAR